MNLYISIGGREGKAGKRNEFVHLKSKITVLRHFQYDESVLIQPVERSEPLLLSGRMASNIMIRLNNEK